MNEQENSDVGERFRRTLNRHGHSFQYTVVKRALDLNRERRSEWEYLDSEFPVIVNNKSTRIDFIFCKARPTIFLIAECKRVNPAYSDWCFANSSYARDDSSLNEAIFQYAWLRPPDRQAPFTNIDIPAASERFETGIQSNRGHPDIFHIGRAVRSEKKGDSNGRNSDEIEEASGQVCKGLNGMIEYFQQYRSTFPNNSKVYFLPAIFTTARIWTTTVDLASANIENGELSPGSVSVIERPWVWYQYHVSPDLQHSAPRDRKERSPFDISEILNQEFARTIAIVGVKGIEDFLHRGFPWK